MTVFINLSRPMTLKYVSIALIAAGMLTAGCSKKEDDAQKAAEVAAKAAQQMAEGAAKTASGGTANKTPGVAIPAKTLAGFLGTPSGFKMDGEPETMEMDFQGQKYSHAQGKFMNGDKRITISIFDYNFIAGLTAAYSAMMSMNMETNDESLHSEKIGGFPAWIDWKKKNSEGTIGVVVNDRIFVVTEGQEGVSLDELKAASNSVNYSGIASAAK
jgi:hypothetical protein